ncbi:MAG: single-stranded-DNA-specific exonuclease RecJ [Firmicutes bacterium]|nr:single-stranded-DNA-specific exonuclease RecJ [Bacillota bacterium]
MTDEIRNNIVLELLKLRGIETEEDISEYLSDLPKRTYDPFLMKNMKEATDLILAEAAAGSRICIYGDYDVDGITSVCILYEVLSRLTDQLTWYIPSRFTEGYGLHNEAIDSLRADGVDLIITVDCGITSDKEAAYAQSLGMRMIVTDHHQLGDTLPDCIVIDPKQEDETYPFRDLAGCGVAYKLAQAIQRQAGLDRSVIVEALDLVASGTVADIVPLLDENRTIVKYGLHKLNERGRKGLAALEEAISLKEINSGSISYGIAPHLNAAGRMRNAGEAVRLLLAEDHDNETIRTQVETLIACNNERKKLQDDAYRRSKERIKGTEAIICLRVDGIHEGIAGIAAGKLKEDFMRPVILATDSGDGMLKGTGRSINGVDLFALLDAHRDLFARVGGHKRACGFTISEDNFRTLQPLLEEEVARIYEADPSILEQTGRYDLEIEAEDVTLQLAEALQVMEPFGEANEQPRFLVRDLKVRWPSYMGDRDQHVRFKGEKKGARIQCVLFQKAQDYADRIESQQPVSVIGTVEINEWNDRKDVQMIVKEIV